MRVEDKQGVLGPDEAAGRKRTISVSHRELSLLLYALDRDIHGDPATPSTSAPSCEEDCPIVESFASRDFPPEKRLAGHLNGHLREAWIECGLLGLREADQDRARLDEVSRRLEIWSCDLVIDDSERRMLRSALSRLPRSAWLTMPRTLWRLRKKVKGSRIDHSDSLA